MTDDPTDATALTTAAELFLTPSPTPHDQNPAAVYLARLAPGSRRSMRQALNLIAGLLSGGRATALTLPWSSVRYQHAQAVRARLAADYAVASGNKMLAAPRGVLRESWRLGQISAEDFHRAADLGSVKGSPLPRGRALAAGELRALFTHCSADKSVAGARDAALLATLYAGGLRRSEAVALDLEDYSDEDGALAVRAGKGNKGRVAYLSAGAQAAVRRWLRARADGLTARGSDSPALFLPLAKGGKVMPRRMTDQGVMKALRTRALKAGVARFSSHDLRRSFISDLLDAGADISAVQRLAGHASVSTTARYDRRGEVVKRKAAGLLHVAFEDS